MVTVNTAWITTNVKITLVVNGSAPILSAVSSVIVLLVSLARATPVSILTRVMIHLSTQMRLVPTLAHSIVLVMMVSMVMALSVPISMNV